MTTQINVLDIEAVLEKLRIGRSKLYGMVNANQFPRPVKIGRSSRWVESEIDEWLIEKMETREPTT